MEAIQVDLAAQSTHAPFLTFFYREEQHPLLDIPLSQDTDSMPTPFNAFPIWPHVLPC